MYQAVQQRNGAAADALIQAGVDPWGTVHQRYRNQASSPILLAANLGDVSLVERMQQQKCFGSHVSWDRWLSLFSAIRHHSLEAAGRMLEALPAVSLPSDRQSRTRDWQTLADGPLLAEWADRLDTPDNLPFPTLTRSLAPLSWGFVQAKCHPDESTRLARTSWGFMLEVLGTHSCLTQRIRAALDPEDLLRVPESPNPWRTEEIKHLLFHKPIGATAVAERPAPPFLATWIRNWPKRARVLGDLLEWVGQAEGGALLEREAPVLLAAACAGGAGASFRVILKHQAHLPRSAWTQWRQPGTGDTLVHAVCGQGDRQAGRITLLKRLKRMGLSFLTVNQAGDSALDTLVQANNAQFPMRMALALEDLGCPWRDRTVDIMGRIWPANVAFAQARRLGQQLNQSVADRPTRPKVRL